PPIDLLSAFSERALGGSDRAPVLEHLAHCADCRELVFLAAPEVISAAEQGSNAHSSGRLISWPVLRWASVAACAVIVVAAVRLRPNYRHPRPGITIVAGQNQQAASKVAPEVPTESVSSSVSAVQSGRETSEPQRLRDVPGKAKAVPRILSLPPDDNLSRQMGLVADAETDMRRPTPRWTLAADGTLQRSLDGGISWKPIHVARDHIFRAVAVAGRSVWLGGKLGVLFHSSDSGQHWTQLKTTADRPLPDSDIIGIEFEDELHGKLTTASNESWTTSDAGHTWQKQ
ncbi:MAG: YCF48-related protein, partial [Terriglobales bacterium]